MRSTSIVKWVSIFLVLLLTIPVLGGDTTEPEGGLLMVRLNSEIDMDGLEVIQMYPDYALVDGKERYEILRGHPDVIDLGQRSGFYIHGERHDIPSDPELRYLDGFQGLYLVHLIGPVHPQWRDELIERGAEIIDYVPDHAYKVYTTSEVAVELNDLFFVEAVSTYRPEYKISPAAEPGLVFVGSVNGDRRTIEGIPGISILQMDPDGTSALVYVDDQDSMDRLARVPEVISILPYHPPRLMDEIGSQIIGGGCWIMDDDDDPNTPYREYGDHGAYVNQIGYTGDGVTIALADTGIGDGTVGDAGHPDFTGRVMGGFDYQTWSSEEGAWADGSGHGTHVAGLAGGNTYSGTQEVFPEHYEVGDYYLAQSLAPDAGIYAQRIFDDDENWVGPSDYYQIVQNAKMEAGAYIHVNSWGEVDDGSYREVSQAYDKAVRDADMIKEGNQPMVIVVAAGNSGPDETSITSPGTAKNVITVGASENYLPDFTSDNPYNIAGFSSRGWTQDGRIKPDVVAPGMARASTYWDADSETYDHMVMEGTSQSCPTVAGAAAVVVGWYEEVHGVTPSPAMVKAMLINTARPLDPDQGNTGHIPNREEGWGMVFLPDLISSSTNIEMVDQESQITTGEEEEHSIKVSDHDEPLKLTLTWTDAPASAGADPTLRNDLDLEMISPAGDVYRGNAFQEGWTPPNANSNFDNNGDGRDDRNNVENIYIHPDNLEEGVYTIRVVGKNVPADADGDGSANQDYALVMNNAFKVNAPEPPEEPVPVHGARGLHLDVELSVRVTHSEDKTMDLTFYSSDTVEPIGSVSDVESGARAGVVWSSLEAGTRYGWFVEADDGDLFTHSPTWNFTTSYPPDEPVDPTPSNETTGVRLNTSLSVLVSDRDGDAMNVSFYTSDHELLGEDTHVENHTRAEINIGPLEPGTDLRWYAVADDGISTTRSPVWSFLTKRPPDTPAEPLPDPGSTGLEEDVVLSVNISDPDGHDLDVTFFDASDGSIIGELTGVTSGERVEMYWEGLETGTTYEWYVKVDDGELSTVSDVFNFTTNHPPSSPTDPYPADGAHGLPEDIRLAVPVHDEDGDTMSATFFDASDDSEIGSVTGLESGEYAEVDWHVERGQTHEWYVVIDDGVHSTTSETWNFTTNHPPDPPELKSPSHRGSSSTDPELKVLVNDPDGDELTVRFYDASNDELIGEVEGVESGSTVRMGWDGLSTRRDYEWYVEVDDGMYVTTSDTWSFSPRYPLYLTLLPFVVAVAAALIVFLNWYRKKGTS